jgi:CRP-like cAMP-binding protein
MLTTIEKVIFLQNVDVFDQVPTEQLVFLAAIAEETTVAARTDVYREEEPSDALYLVLDGAVRLHREGREITVAGVHEAFGTWALFDESPRVATATAVEESHLLRINRDDFVDLLAENVQITEGVLKTVVGRLRGLVERVGLDSMPRP